MFRGRGTLVGKTAAAIETGGRSLIWDYGTSVELLQLSAVHTLEPVLGVRGSIAYRISLPDASSVQKASFSML